MFISTSFGVFNLFIPHCRLIYRQWGKIIPEENINAGSPVVDNCYNITYTDNHGTPIILSFLSMNWGSTTSSIRNASLRYGSIYRDTFVYYVTENITPANGAFIFWLAIG